MVGHEDPFVAVAMKTEMDVIHLGFQPQAEGLEGAREKVRPFPLFEDLSVSGDFRFREPCAVAHWHCSDRNVDCPICSTTEPSPCDGSHYFDVRSGVNQVHRNRALSASQIPAGCWRSTSIGARIQ